MSFRLSTAQRIRWAIGSTIRAGVFLLFTLLICWLGYVSIGRSAVIVVLIMVFGGHWIPYLLAGRNRLTATPDGLYDHVRFRKRRFDWVHIGALHIVSPAPSVHGLVADVYDPSTGDTRGEFLRASWRPTREEAETLLHDLEHAGWVPKSPDPSIEGPGELTNVAANSIPSIV
jgi:hypothetical protein